MNVEDLTSEFKVESNLEYLEKMEDNLAIKGDKIC